MFSEWTGLKATEGVSRSDVVRREGHVLGEIIFGG
jgi:hypothetical protein